MGSSNKYIQYIQSFQNWKSSDSYTYKSNNYVLVQIIRWDWSLEQGYKFSDNGEQWPKKFPPPNQQIVRFELLERI